MSFDNPGQYNCETCGTTSCKYHKQRGVLARSIDHDGREMMTPARFTKEKGCREWEPATIPHYQF